MRHTIFYRWVVTAGWIAIIAGFAALAIRCERPGGPSAPSMAAEAGD